MSRTTRIRILIAVIAVLAAVLVVINIVQRNTTPQPTPIAASTEPDGTVALYFNGKLVTNFAAADIANLDKTGFEDAQEGKLQQGPLLRDVLLQYMDETTFTPDTRITVSASSRDKAVELTWEQVADPDNHVLFDPSSNRGTLKLVSSSLATLDTRAEWIQDTDRIDVQQS